MADLTSPGDAPSTTLSGRLPWARHNVFYGWWMLSGMVALLTYGSGTFFHGFSVFFNPIQSEFGWSRAETAFAFSLARLEGGIEGPFSGWLINRLGARTVAIVGTVSVAVGFIVLSFVQSLLMFYFLYGILLSLGFNVGFFRPCQQAVVTWFRRKRGMALGVLMMAPSLGGALVVPLMAWAVTMYGWRTTSVLVGIGLIVIGLPLSFVVRGKPEELGLLPDGEPAPMQTVAEAKAEPMPEAAAPDAERSLTLKQAARTSAFWVLAVFEALRHFGQSAVLVHLIPMLIDKGYDPIAAAGVTAFAALVGAPSRFFFGWLSDRMEKRYILVLTLVSSATGVTILTHADAPAWVYFCMVLWGVGQGAVPLRAALQAECFGPKHFSIIQGMTGPITMLGAVGGPWIAGYAFDVSGSYTQVLQGVAASFVLAALSVAFLLRMPRHPRAERPAA